MDESAVGFCGESAYCLCRAVGGVVVYDDDVVWELRLLLQCALDGINDGFLAVEDGYDDGSLRLEHLFVEVGLLTYGGVHLCPDGLEVLRGGTLHLYLHAAVARIDVVELFLTAFARVGFFLGVE